MKITSLLLAVFLGSPSLGLGQSFEPSEEDLRFLELVQRKSFDYFLKEHHPVTGLVKDRASNFVKDSNTIASIASTGFALSAMVVGAERGWISKGEAQEYSTKTLRFFSSGMESHHGFFYHFVDWGTGEKTKHTELSSIDTAIFLAGALTAGEYFKGTEVERLAKQIYEKVDFPWMLNGGETLSMGWHPNPGFLAQRWQDYNESFILYLLAIGSPTHPIPPASWHQVKKRIGLYEPHVLIFSPPLFTHQYSHIWVDFRNKNDGVADYFENSRTATVVNRQFCLDHRGTGSQPLPVLRSAKSGWDLAHRGRYQTYSENVWGLTASEGPFGYRAYGAEPGGGVHDGTVAPTAAGSSIVFTPELSLKALREMYDRHKDKIWGKYGFSDAFNLDRNWVSKYVLGIDQGPLLLMIENFRSELLWKIFMHHPAVVRGMELAGFREGPLALRPPAQPSMGIDRSQEKIKIDGLLKEWNLTPSLTLDPAIHHELGKISGKEDASADLFLRWDKEFLYLAARVFDESLVGKKLKDKIWQDDILELFIDPQADGLGWGDPKDIQLGFSPGPAMNEGRSWAWFQAFDPAERGLVQFEIKTRSGGYDVEARISFKLLKIEPQPNMTFGFSPALHDIDEDESEGKLQWYFLPEGKSGRNLLGRARLQ